MQQHQITFPLDHPAFVGHFPGQPIVPGVLLLDWAMRCLQNNMKDDLVTPKALNVTKFLSPARPGELLELDFVRVKDSVQFEIRSASRTIANGRFALLEKACL